MPEARLKPLTDKQVLALVQTSAVGGVPGLECVVSTSGTKSWRLLYRLTGDTSAKRRSIGLGRYWHIALTRRLITNASRSLGTPWKDRSSISPRHRTVLTR